MGQRSLDEGKDCLPHTTPLRKALLTATRQLLYQCQHLGAT
jgi:hypothetical protein